MRLSLYARLAAQNIRKSRRLYVPYLLSCICMVMIHYILGALTGDPAIRSMPGGGSLTMLLQLGAWVMVLFSLLFLLYTSSFLMKQRSRELSLYNMLGMSKRHVVSIVFFETLFCAAIGIGAGLGLGVLCSKAFQLALLRLTGSPVSPDFTVAPSLLVTSAGVFGAIFLLIFLRGMTGVLHSNPIGLMRASQAGEKPPRANALSALLGIILLAAGYAMAVRVKSPLDAFSLFFIAVLLVIAGTFSCFSSASVFFLRLLQANTAYYYRPNHFISVSGMRYRMKRNGTSLAVICILSTMVLVVLSAVTCLYIGTQEMLLTRYPREIEFTMSTGSVPDRDTLSSSIDRLLEAEGLCAQRPLFSRSLSLAGRVSDSGMMNADLDVTLGYSCVTVMPLEDYNALCGTDYTLGPGEALATGLLPKRLPGTFSFFGERSYRIVDTDIPLPPDAGADLDVVESMLLIVEDVQEMEAINLLQAGVYEGRYSHIYTSYAFDTGLEPAAHDALASRLNQALAGEGFNIGYKTRERNRADYEGSNAGFLFLGVMLSAAFLCAAVLSMYYKQITEGYEDQARFDVMRKVGLSQRMIRQSINSQMLTVFLLPLLAAGLHTAFAFPMLSKLLVIFGLTNTGLLAWIALVSYGAFSLLYVLVYAVTSRTYYRIVSAAPNA